MSTIKHMEWSDYRVFIVQCAIITQKVYMVKLAYPCCMIFQMASFVTNSILVITEL